MALACGRLGHAGRSAALHRSPAAAPRAVARPIGVRAQSGGSGAEPEASGAPPAAAPAAAAPEQQQQQQQPAPATVPAPSAPVLAPGQGTAIVTGAISVVFGVAYLALVYVMDMRGGEMLPPPPEAFIP
ncbi:hypothetical protein Rsub_10800 [Raphidocelis subcapitata]|uniref:Uncharacterized protein n=1 Tax=Raphidocelis subcapitata TaxID=307507 RepID=A0A2V0PFL3_9CHLO|nr:hypothetical protein Rsub_10800 [Raphidocelis subcapitata]|eukprot:GBF98611.1 hypothetical protein Rsub_10800 [Raphidocelis subcapitata]